jgi:hypothetical protein
MDIAHCASDKDQIATCERVWILNLGTLSNGLNVVLPIDRSIWVSDRPGRWLLDPRNVRFPEVAVKINALLQSAFHQCTTASLAKDFTFLSANRSRTVLRWLELYPDPNDPVAVAISAAIVLARGKHIATLKRKSPQTSVVTSSSLSTGSLPLPSSPSLFLPYFPMMTMMSMPTVKPLALLRMLTQMQIGFSRFLTCLLLLKRVR